MEDNLDLTNLLEMLDVAMSSDNPTVKKCFQNLMLVVALVHAENKTEHTGPLKELLTRISMLEREINILKADKYSHINGINPRSINGIGIAPYQSNPYVNPYSKT